MIKGVLNYAYWHPKKHKVLFKIKEQLTIILPDSDVVVVIPVDYDTDFASIPWWFRSIVPTVGKHSIPALAHDYLYDNKIGSRKTADKVFLKLMIQYKVSWMKAHLMYWGVRIGGRPWWRS